VRILVVDDDAVAVELLSSTLADAGYEVDSATDGRAALERLSQCPSHVLITDWQMPELDGLDLCRAVRQADFGHYVYMIVLTARDGPRNMVQGLEAGADDFIPKPFDAAEVIARLRVAERLLSLEMRNLAIFALAKLAESRDPETGGHLERVQNYSRVLAEHFRVNGLSHSPKVDAGYVSLIYQTSPLHDIGKVAIPDSVLLKAGRLSDDEFEVMKTHTTLGAQTLNTRAPSSSAWRSTSRRRTTSGSMAPAIRRAWLDMISRCADASSRWRTCTTR
jgi:putative two-component system response regulator